MNDDLRFAAERRRMVEEQIAGRGIRDARLLEAMRTVPRHLFVARREQRMAYLDSPLQIGCRQTISQPYIVALMTELLALGGDERVLEVGTGSGYQAAILGLLAGEVHTIERHTELGERAQATLAALGFANVTVHIGDGSNGLPDFAPYQAILVTAAAPRVPQPLLDQLAVRGRMVLPVGGLGEQVLELWVRRQAPEGASPIFDQHRITAVAFVPLRGQHGWEQDW